MAGNGAFGTRTSRLRTIVVIRKLVFAMITEPQDQLVSHSLNDLGGPEYMIEARMYCVWVDTVGESELLQIVKPLNYRSVQQLQLELGKLLVTIKSSAKDLAARIMKKIHKTSVLMDFLHDSRRKILRTRLYG